MDYDYNYYPQKPVDFVLQSENTKQGELDFQISSTQDVSDVLALSPKLKKLRVETLANEFNIDQRKMMLKIDLYVLVPFFFLCFIANMNRGHFGLLWLNGVMGSLHMLQLQYFALVSAYYAPYVLCQMFSNFVLKSVRPHFYISLLVLIYGAVVLATAFTKSYGAFVTCEFLHGLFQSGCDSAVYYIISNYYERSESQKRLLIMFLAAPLALIFNNLVLYGISQHLHLWSAWRWLLAIQGAITMFMAFVLFFVIPDFPEGNRFLTDNETLFIIRKLELYTGKSGYNIPFTVKDILKNFADITIIIAALTANLLGGVMNAYSFVEPFGYVALKFFNSKGLVESIWPWVASFFTIIVFGYALDLMGKRFPIIYLSCCMMLTGTAIIHFGLIYLLGSNPARLAGNFLVAMGAYLAFPEFISWASFNLNGHLRKSVITSLMISFSDLSGVYCTYALLHGTAGASVVGFIFSICAIGTITIYLLLLRYQNKAKRTQAYKDSFDQLSEKQKILAGDKNPAFDYLY